MIGERQQEAHVQSDSAWPVSGWTGVLRPQHVSHKAGETACSAGTTVLLGLMWLIWLGYAGGLWIRGTRGTSCRRMIAVNATAKCAQAHVRVVGTWTEFVFSPLFRVFPCLRPCWLPWEPLLLRPDSGALMAISYAALLCFLLGSWNQAR